MKPKTLLRDQSFWFLLLINVAIIFYYYRFHTGFKTLVWIYWTQSVLIGFFTYLDLLTLKSVVPGSMEMNGEPVKDSGSMGCISGFFAMHFGIFHFVYFIFLFNITEPTEAFDWRLYEFSVGAFALDQVWSFIRRKQWEQTHDSNVGVLFFLPYLRVVPMHFTILIPSFINAIPRLGIFLVLKLFADMLFYALTVKLYGKQEGEDPTVLRTIK